MVRTLLFLACICGFLASNEPAQVKESANLKEINKLLNSSGISLPNEEWLLFKFSSLSTQNPLLFVRVLKSVVSSLAPENEVYYISRAPLELGIRTRRSEELSLASLLTSLGVRGIRTLDISQDGFEIGLLLDTSKASLDVPVLERELSLMQGNLVALPLGLGFVELFSRGAREWSAKLVALDMGLNPLASSTKDPKERSIVLAIPPQTAYVLASDIRGTSESSLVLSAVFGEEQDYLPKQASE